MRVAQRLALGRLVSLGAGSAAYIALVAAIFGETGSALWVSCLMAALGAVAIAGLPGKKDRDEPAVAGAKEVPTR